VSVLVELPRRRAAPRVFVEPSPDLERRIARALAALGALPECLGDLPGYGPLSECLIAILDGLEGDPDLEPDADDEIETVDDLPLFTFAARAKPPP
jgi:hypothetical protein